MRDRDTDEPKWTPYGHESARRQLLVQRHAWLVVGAIGVAMFYAMFLGLTFSVETDVQSGGTVDIEREEQKPMTVTVAPGRAPAFATSDAQEPDGRDAPSVEREEDGLILSTVRPILPVVLPLVGAFWLLSRVGASSRGKLAELNFGVYKGAMPYEMHTVGRYKQVFTHRRVEDHVFGKSREDFLPEPVRAAPPISVRRLLGTPEAEEAQVVRLRQGSSRRAAPPPSKPASTASLTKAERVRRQQAKNLQDRARDAWHEQGVQGVYRLLRREHDRRTTLRRRAKRVHDQRCRESAGNHQAESGRASPDRSV